MGPAILLPKLLEASIETFKRTTIRENRCIPGSNDVTCPVCLEDYVLNDTLRFMPEREHCFHVECIAAVVPPCPTVDSHLSACIPYIEGQTPDIPPPACCTGVKIIAGEQKNQQDRVTICNCIKQAIPVLGHPVISTRIAHLPKKCGLGFEFPAIDAHYDCSK
ncbi:non-specific lipid-transfer protein-like [Primulina eburnea]|uniref:non-specific lipid-transfer protein-like n=1 Tax=Primulina eburnea TaxID=1245227 RepID=UPI003C6C6E02